MEALFHAKDIDCICWFIDSSISYIRLLCRAIGIWGFGTENIDDWYPGFVGNWTPENLSINEGAKS
jgi:hypothetical protein